jgi:ATP-binding cassette, subfamily B, bacterial
LIVVTTRFYGDRIKQYRRAASRATARVTGFVGEVFGAVQAIKVGAAETPVLLRLRQLGDERRQASVRDRLAAELMNAFGMNFIHVAIGLVMLLGAAKLRSGRLTVGELSLFFSYITGMMWCPRFLGHLLYRQRHAAVAIDRMVRTLDAAPHQAVVAPAPLYLAADADLPPVPSRRRTAHHRLRALEATGITHLFPSSHHGVHDVSFSLSGGSFTVITGPVGSGKTTLLRALLGLLPDHDGVVRWNGKVVEERGHFFVPPRAAYTAQVPRLFSEPIADNILLGHDDDGRLARAMWRAVLEEDLADMEHGAATVIGPRGVRLSGGQVQRVAAARMLAQDASLLVFDDLSSALDVDTEHQLWERLLGERDGQTTCLVVSHRPAVLRRADQILVLDEGRVVASGTYRQVRRAIERTLPERTA